ncbi:hypothetical protein [Aureimonas leprariae]|uniref:Uncharacterized protein n=1 Tax=Plantimonas leprariae TaxID=2615207 RepID=A0A7V7PN96_9HYPH|nr:hypothetical protein [Aureimonas leprariae]KAB0679063.1 hypothetical protein F6X38_14305 [Aureimonas leprariae]
MPVARVAPPATDTPDASPRAMPFRFVQPIRDDGPRPPLTLRGFAIDIVTNHLDAAPRSLFVQHMTGTAQHQSIDGRHALRAVARASVSAIRIR